MTETVQGTRDLTPREIVAELDHHIIGQDAAKRAVAIAVRNRWRRRQLDPDLAREVNPKNIIMVGPTGVGKTEIARRLAKLVNAPFVKVEASKYTEVGYHGRDVESMVRDLVEIAANIVRGEQAERVRAQAEKHVEDRLVALLMGDMQLEKPKKPTTRLMYTPANPEGASTPATDEKSESEESEAEVGHRVRERLRAKLREGMFEDREIEIHVRERKSLPIMGMMGPDQMDPNMSSMLESILPEQTKRRKVMVARARSILLEEETAKLIDNEKIAEQAIERTETSGIIFLDEIDKIASPSNGQGKGSADVSRQGVQRDLLPIVEGSAVNTRHGVVHTDGILFIAAGAFHVATISDLMPELQGRFPIRVELTPLTRDDFKRILTEPKGALTVQQTALLGTEGLTITYDDAAIDAMADLAAQANERLENIGARRLMTIIECVFEEIAFDAPELVKKGEKSITITEPFVRERLARIMKDEDLSRFVL